MSWEQKKFLRKLPRSSGSLDYVMRFRNAIKIWRYAVSGCCGILLEANVGNHKMDNELKASSSVKNEDDIIASSSTDFDNEDVEDIHPRNKAESLHPLVSNALFCLIGPCR